MPTVKLMFNFFHCNLLPSLITSSLPLESWRFYSNIRFFFSRRQST